MMRRFLKRLTVFLVLLAGTYGGVWFAASWYLGDLFDRWVSEQRARGHIVSFENREKQGFPTEWRIKVTNPRILTPSTNPARADWTAPFLFVHWSPFSPKQLLLRSGGAQKLNTTGLDLPPQIDFTAHKLVLSLPLGRDWPRNYGFSLDGLVTKDLPKGDVEITRLETSVSLQEPATVNPDKKAAPPETAKVNIKLFGLTLPPSVTLPLGRTISTAGLEASLTGTITDGVDQRTRLSRWRDQGGTVEITGLDLAWSHLTLDSNGTLALDSELRPLAAVTARIAGHQQLLDALVAAGTVKSSQALIARFAFTALAQKGGTDDGKIVVPLEAQDGWLRLGPLKLVRLKPLVK